MKTIIALSDTHGNRAAIEKLMPLFAESDYIFHLGDTSADGNIIKKAYPDKTYLLNGNCDGVFPLGEDEITLKVEDTVIFLCHGHRLGVKSGTGKLLERAKEAGASLAMFGHTHKAVEKAEDGITLLNPGTLTKYCDRKTYAYIAVNGEKFTCKICDFTG